MTAWLSSPVPLALMLALVIATFHHLQLGLQVVIEDYVPHEGQDRRGAGGEGSVHPAGIDLHRFGTEDRALSSEE